MVDSRGHRAFSDGAGPGQRRSPRAGIDVSAYAVENAKEEAVVAEATPAPAAVEPVEPVMPVPEAAAPPAPQVAAPTSAA